MLRERALLREFEEYRQSKQKRLNVFRLEAVRAGFKKAWQERDYATIIAVARKIPENVLQEGSSDFLVGNGVHGEVLPTF